MATSSSLEWIQLEHQDLVSPVDLSSLPEVAGFVLFSFGTRVVFVRPVSVITDHLFHTYTFHVSQRIEPAITYREALMVGYRKTLGQIFSLTWPHYWRRNGSAWDCIFPHGKVVVVYPPDHPTLPSHRVGPVTPRELRIHLRDERSASKAFALKRQQRERRLYMPFASGSSRPSPETSSKTVIMKSRYQSSGFPHVNPDVPVILQTYFRSYAGSKTPGFKKSKRRHLPVNPYTCTIIKTNDGPSRDLRDFSSLPGHDYNYAWGYTSAMFSLVVAAPTHDVSIYNRAVLKCIERASIGMSSNVAQDIAQFGQTTGLIADTATRLAAALAALRHKRFSDATEILLRPSRVVPHGQGGIGIRMPVKVKKYGKQPSAAATLAENWLALQYGWKPLLMDIHGALKSLAQYFVQTPSVVRTARGKAEKLSGTRVPVGYITGNPPTFHFQGWQETVTASKVTVGFRYTIDSKLKAFLAQTGFTNPVNLFWEVLPYSFVVDWFVPIGPYLETLSAYDGLAFSDGFVSRLTTRDTYVDVNVTGKRSYTGALVFDQNGRFERQHILVNRDKLVSFPTLVQPSFKNPLSIDHALNAVALLATAFGLGQRRK